MKIIKHRTSKNQKGFTIVELLIATVIFSVVLMMCLAAIIQIGRMYYKGVTEARLQEVARTVMDEITQSIQFTGEGVTAANNGTPYSTGQPRPFNYFCIGENRYSYIIDGQLKAGINNPAQKRISHVLWVDQPAGGCYGNSAVTSAVELDSNAIPPTGSAAGGREVLAENMRITRLNVTPVSTPTGGEQLWRIDLALSYGDDDVLDPLDAQGRRTCKGSSAGTQFCAISELTTIVKRRVQKG